MAYCVISPKHITRRLDIYISTQEECPFALLHWTGSKDFNIEVRKIALKKGFSLSEYSMVSLLKKYLPRQKVIF